jgi:hypothetical protein
MLKSNYYQTKIRPKIKRAGRALGIKASRSKPIKSFPPYFDDETIEIINRVNEFTMTSVERLQVLIEAVRYIDQNNIEGSLVECGVWRGGSMMAAALTLESLGDRDRELYLYDTYEGMNAPTSEDGKVAREKFSMRRIDDDSSEWCRSVLEEVTENLANTGYPTERMHFIRGKVEETLPDQAPAGEIALLRLDTDWYESTRREMLHLYPKLVRGGILILDDYDYWQGCRQAVDEYLEEFKPRLLLHRIDASARIAVKQ